jgi:O-antigen/teichoic acid export membrane protein
MPFGMADAGLASIATFAIGLVAARTLSAEDLGAYAVYFTAFQLGSVIPTQLILIPAEVVITTSVGGDMRRRLMWYRRSLLLGAVAALPGLVAIGLAHLLSGASPSIAVSLTVTAGAAVVLSPLQDHMRRMAHLAGDSRLAAVTSLVQVTTAVAAIFGLRLLNLPPAWIPFGALAVANAVSLGVSIWAANLAVRRGPAEGNSVVALSIRALATRGRWLVLSAAIGAGAGFAAAVLVTALAGAEWLGYAEAARVVAQPLLVLVLGLSAVTGPYSVTAAAAGDHRTARRISRRFIGIVVLTGAASLAMVGGDWWWNPMSYLVPLAYDVAWLVAVTIVVNTLKSTLWPYRSELLGGRKEPALASVDSLSGLAAVGMALTAPWTLAFARPLGTLAVGTTSAIGYLAALRSHYRKSGARSKSYQDDGPPSGGRVR